MKRLLLTTTLVLTLFSPIHLMSETTQPQSIQKVASRPRSFTSYPSDVRAAVERIEKLPEAMALLARVKKEGPVHIRVAKGMDFDFEALWDSEARTIVINGNQSRSLGNIICSILFELHNARTDKYLLSHFERASKGLISKEDYVRSIEKMEHDNALNTCRLIHLGITRGLFPIDATWNIYEDFESHYMIQQLFGHSQWLAERYDYFAPKAMCKPYVGTIEGLESFTEMDKDQLLQYIQLKNELTSPSSRVRTLAMTKLQNELEDIRRCENGDTHINCAMYKEKKKLLILCKLIDNA